MARSPASGRGWTDDGHATGKSFRDPVEAWWKHEGKNRCAILTIRAQFGLVALSRNWQDVRKKTRFVAPDLVSFDTTHNLKAAGSNPAPATKNTRLIKDFKAEHNARLYSFQILVNTWSTFDEAPTDGADNRRRTLQSCLRPACRFKPSPDLRGDLRERTSFESRSLRVGPPLRHLRRIGREPLRQANREGDWNNRIALCGFLGP